MRSAVSRLPHAALVPSAVAATVFVTALGSSSVAELSRIGRPLRWLALLVVLGTAALAAAGRRDRPAGLRPPAVATIWLCVFMLTSALWSVQPRLTAARAVSLGLVLAAAGLSAYAAAGAAVFAERLLFGVVAGAAAVALAGLPLLAVDHADAVRPASVGVPARYQGIGQSPNTVALLLAVAVPLATWMALTRQRLAGIAALALFWGTLAASASRGGLLGALAGSLVVIGLLAHGRRALAAGALVCAVFVAAVTASRLSQGIAPASGAAPARPPAAQPRYVDVQKVFPLDDDLGRPLPGRGDNEGSRTLLGSSGRTDVWNYALGQVLHRPVAGYGFGTEEKVFVDRFANFDGGRVENSYIGWLLQLGVVGLASFVAVVVAAVATGRRGLRGDGVGAAAAGALAGGLVVALVQSYVYSAGDIAALSFWLAAALVAVAAVPARKVVL